MFFPRFIGWFDYDRFTLLLFSAVFVVSSLQTSLINRFPSNFKALMERKDEDGVHNCVIKLRINPQKHREKVYIGCGAGFGSDRPMGALKLLQRVKDLNYLVLECLAERTLAERFQNMASGGDGYDTRISEWMAMLLPLAVERGVCIITNLGAMDPPGAQDKVLEIADSMGLRISVAVAHEVSTKESGSGSSTQSSYNLEGGSSTYLGAAPIVECLEKYRPNVVITSRVADAALFLAPMVYELGWNWDDLLQLAQGLLAGHLLECGCQLTGGYYMHPGDKYREISFSQLLDTSLPYAEISFDGRVCVAKAEGSGGILNASTCAQQLLYEVGDPGRYIIPDLVIDLLDVTFYPLSDFKVLCTGSKASSPAIPEKLLRLVPKDRGWKGWGEISYGGHECVKRARAAEFLVRSWMEEVFPGVNGHILSYIIGVDSLKATSSTSDSMAVHDIRLRMDGLFPQKEQAVHFTREFMALYTNGPAGGGGISTGHKKEVVLDKQLVTREHVFWRTGVKSINTNESGSKEKALGELERMNYLHEHIFQPARQDLPNLEKSPIPSGRKIALYNIAHSRAGDKGNDLNFSIIPHYPSDIKRLKMIITHKWVEDVVSKLSKPNFLADLDPSTNRESSVDEHVSVEIYDVPGIHSLNIVVRNILDGGVNCSRRIDRHGKTISDLVLCQQVVLPPG